MPFYAAARVSEVVGAIALFGPKVRMPQLTQTEWYQAGNAGFGIMPEGAGGMRGWLVGLQEGFGSGTGGGGPRAAVDGKRGGQGKSVAGGWRMGGSGRGERK